MVPIGGAEAASKDASLGVGHVWWDVTCPAYRARVRAEALREAASVLPDAHCADIIRARADAEEGK